MDSHQINQPALFPAPTWRNLTACLVLGFLTAFTLQQLFGPFNLARADSSIVLSMDSASGVTPGASVNLNIYINPSNAPEQPAALGWDILYNTADVASIAWNADGAAATAAGKSGDCATPSPGDFRCLIVGFNENTIGQGTLGTITVTLTATTLATSIPLQFSNLSAADVSANSIEMTANNGSIGVRQNQSNNTPPTVSITAPSSQASVSGPSVTITASATPANGDTISSVGFYLDGSSLLGTASVAPYSISWNSTGFSNGTHILTAQATDSQGLVGTSPQVTININNPVISPLQCQPTSALNISSGGSVSFLVSGGQSPYTLNASGASNISGLTATYNSSGSYPVTATDSSGQTASCGTVTVTQTAPATFTATATATATANCSNGTATTATATATATSSVSQQDAQNQAQNQAQAQAQSQAQAECPAPVGLSCQPTSSLNIDVGGSASFQGSGGSGNYSLSALGGSVSGLSVVFNAAGNYPVSLSDSSGNQASCGTVTVTQAAPATFTDTATATATANAQCAGGSTASATATATATATSSVSQQDAQNQAQNQAQAQAQSQAQAEAANNCPAVSSVNPAQTQSTGNCDNDSSSCNNNTNTNNDTSSGTNSSNQNNNNNVNGNNNTITNSNENCVNNSRDSGYNSSQNSVNDFVPQMFWPGV